MPHRNSVADGDGRKYDRNAPCFRYAKLYGVYDFIQVHMTRNDFIIRAYNADHRLFHFFFGKSQCVE